MGFLVDGKPMEYITIGGGESMGNGFFGVKIAIASNDMPNLKDDDSFDFRVAVRNASETIEKEFKKLKNKTDPRIDIATQENRDEIIGLFDGLSIYIEEIPNGYCSDYCCEHLPWFVVTTKVGRIKIGWRKRVIEINWEDTYESTGFANHLFGGEDTTMGNKYIHAWSLEKAKRYINSIVNDCEYKSEQLSLPND